MSYADARVQREVQQLKRELVKIKERERQTRQGCLDFVQAISESLTSAENASSSSALTTKELVDHACVLLAPDAE